MGEDDDNDSFDKSDVENEDGGNEEEPLNSEDDVTDEDSSELFETDNVVVCQYDKVSFLVYLRKKNVFMKMKLYFFSDHAITK